MYDGTTFPQVEKKSEFSFALVLFKYILKSYFLYDYCNHFLIVFYIIFSVIKNIAAQK